MSEHISLRSVQSPGSLLDLPGSLGSLKTVHLFERRSIDAIDFALKVRRPLLVRGEPGIGKSQLARAAAHALRRPYVSRVLDSQTSARDLLFEVDAVSRLAEAQVQGALRTAGDPKDALKVENFVEPGPLWWAFNWPDAEQRAVRRGNRVPVLTDGASYMKGVVVLLDEIDKADTSVPNGLLDVLGNGSFDSPGGRVALASGQPPPLIVFTTNQERSLPDAFVRRCIVLHLEWPEPESEARFWLERLASAHYPALSALVGRATDLLLEHRARAKRATESPPGQAEFLDLLAALDGEPLEVAEQKLDALHRFVFAKHAAGDGGR